MRLSVSLSLCFQKISLEDITMKTWISSRKIIGIVLTVAAFASIYALSSTASSFLFILPANSSNIRYSVNTYTKEKYLVYTCVKGKSQCSGWGDRLKGISTVYLMALATGRTFGMQMNNPCQVKDYLKPNNIKWDLDPGLLEVPLKKVLSLSTTFISKRMTTIDLDKLFPKDVSYAVTNWETGIKLLGNKRYREALKWTLNMSCYEFYHKMYTDLFSLTEDMQQKLNSFLQTAKPTNVSQLVCAQVRLGQNPTIPRETDIRNKPHTVKAVWKFFDKFKDQQNTRFFVTSDSENVRQEASRRFTEQMTDTDGPIVHPMKSKSNNICNGFTKMILDQYVLSKCDILVISRSGYGRMAAYLRNTQDNVYYFDDGKVTPFHLNKQYFPCKGNNDDIIR